ncbi:putative F-box/FBD/LRR-repeat protein At4g03220 isoform X2 [Lolium perenne]|nr:putative F-box/FBD/LRR-repeat protein At4g03220 isoform X2 [Lolium perenne]
MDLSVELLKLSVADGGGEDRLSALPDDVLIHILVLVKDAAAAARTSVLASRWRRLWPLLPELRFGSIEHHLIGAVLAAHEAPDLSLILAHTKDASPESLSAWLPIAARSLSGAIQLEVVRRESETEIGERWAAIDLPCFEKAIIIKLKLGFLGLALPPSGVFSRLGDLQLVDIQLHGQSSRLGDLLSSQRCPSLMSLLVSDCRGLDSLNIHSNSLLHLKLLYLHHLQQLTVVAPALKRIKVIRCFTDPLNPDQSVVNISAPQLMSLVWKNFRDPSSIQLDEVMNLKMLGIELLFLGGEEEAFDYNHNCMMLLRRFKRIRNLDLLISYLPGICTGPYLMDHMPRLPDITTLHMGVVAYGHSVGAILFNVLRSCTGVKDLFIDFLAELEEQTPCPSGCICDEPPNWRMEELALNCLEEMEIQGMRGTEHEVSFVQRLFRWATVLKE